MAVVQTQKKIVDLGDAPYLRAREISVQRGMKLASNVLHDDYLVGSNRYQKVRRVYAAWARELLVYPEQNGQFVRGKDVVDSHKDNTGREWVLPASDVPEQAIGRQKVGLFVDPENIEVTDKRVVIHPASVVVLDSFIQTLGNGGKVDEATRIPLEVAPELWEKLSDSEKRWLFRTAGVGVRPLVRYVYDINNRRVVDAGNRPGLGYGVAAEATEGGAPRVTSTSKLVISVQEPGKLTLVSPSGSDEQIQAALRVLRSQNLL
ncbi:MAG: hypothetical protein ABII22_02950 [Candidatus Micrarchaeota archaeon]